MGQSAFAAGGSGSGRWARSSRAVRQIPTWGIVDRGHAVVEGGRSVVTTLGPAFRQRSGPREARWFDNAWHERLLSRRLRGSDRWHLRSAPHTRAAGTRDASRYHRGGQHQPGGECRDVKLHGKPPVCRELGDPRDSESDARPGNVPSPVNGYLWVWWNKQF